MIYAYKEQNNNGNYVSLDEVRWVVHFASRLHGNVRDCWKAYESKEAALEQFKLEPYIDPEAALMEEQYLTENTDYGNKTE